MNIQRKLFLLIAVPLLLIVFYQFYVTVHAFNQIDSIRSDVFTQSSNEVRNASDLRFYTLFMDNRLYEMTIAYSNNDANELSTAIYLYRQVQEKRYYALQKLKEIENEGAGKPDFILDAIDQNREALLLDLENDLKESDKVNEKIIGDFGLNPRLPGERNEVGEMIVHSTEPLRKEITEKLTQFIESRYLKMSETDKRIKEVEDVSLKTLMMISGLIFVVGFLVIQIISMIIIQPIEMLSRAIGSGKGSIESIPPSQRSRQDEIGFLIRSFEAHVLLLHEKNHKK